MASKVSVQGVVALGDHFATLCQELDIYEAMSFFHYLSILKKKNLQIEVLSTNLSL